MKVSPQSEAALDKLWRGDVLACGGVSVGPLSEQGIILLRVLVSHYEDLKGRTGLDQARALRRAYAASSSARDTSRGHTAAAVAARDCGAGSAPAASPVAGSRPGWRLVRIQCKSIRGIAASGETFTFPFDGKSTLLFGPNGSGKSSLISAVIWGFTGKTTTDAAVISETSPMYALPSASGKASRIRDWPVIHTLPTDGDPRTLTPECWVNLELRAETGERELHLRRSLAAGLEASGDGITWNPCPTLEPYGISALDLQLSLLAPTVFSRHSIESAPDARHLLSLMLGFDDLELLGDLAANLARNRTLLANEQRAMTDQDWTDLRAKLAVLPGKLREDSPIKAQAAGLAEKGQPTAEEIAAALASVQTVIGEAEAGLASVLGLPTKSGSAPHGLAESLTAAVMTLEKGVWQNFPALAELRLEAVLPLIGQLTPQDRLVALRARIQRFVLTAKDRIDKRFEWWRKERATGSNATLLMQAAQHHDPSVRRCPVCDQSIDGLPVEKELAALKASNPDLLSTLKEFFHDMCEELDEIAPASLRAAGERSPAERALKDWQDLRKTIGPQLASLVSRFDESVRKMASALTIVECSESDVLPSGLDAEFRGQSASLVKRLQEAEHAVGTLAWAATDLASVEGSLHAIITAPPVPGAASLRATLSQGKQAALDIAPLTGVQDELLSAKGLRETIASAEEEYRLLQTIKEAVEPLKLLTKYAASEVAQVFGAIKDRTIGHCRTLYPESPSGFTPARLVMSTGRDRTIEAYLSAGDFEVPSQHYANAGLQRGTSLAFFFALLEQHPGGLGFVVMDDPILSLDDDHRESWSANILKPKLQTTQVILGTHQRQYLNNCRHDFQDGQVVELNPRPRTQCISWRPGNRLDRAADELERAWMNAPVELRKFREEVLITFDSYSPTSFFDPHNLAQSLDGYAAFAEPHPLAGTAQRKIVEILRDPKVCRVLDPGTHALTEADLTEPMVRECLQELRSCEGTLRGELKRLDRLRAHQLRNVALPAPPAFLPFRGVRLEATWADPVEMQVIGRAAARTNSCVVDIAEVPWSTFFPAGGAVLATAETLEPIARRGQWILLAAEDAPVGHGDLVAVVDSRNNRLLRRVWTDGDNWVLQSINPVTPIPSVVLPKAEVALRKVFGVVYEPNRVARDAGGTTITEWQPRSDFGIELVARLRAISIEGSSLDPIAGHGQKVLVAEKQVGRERRVSRASLAVVETNEDAVGNVIKRVFISGRQWFLDSPNPVDPHEPIVISERSIRAVWPVRGVLFESIDAHIT